MSVQTVEDQGVPLCVDLDGTLIRGDLLHESIISVISRRPLTFFLLFWWLLRGKACLKDEIARLHQPRADLLPYRTELLEYLKAERATGRTLVLASASSEVWLQAVNRHLGLFDRVIGSTAEVNLRGRHKAHRLVSEFGVKGFDYIGDSVVDAPIWAASRGALVVISGRQRPHGNLPEEQIRKVFPEDGTGWAPIFRAVRPYQWSKNLLLFTPLLMAHRVFDQSALLPTFLGFLAFCLLSSSVYLLNDLLDIEADREHPHKRHRPLASGVLPVPVAVGLLPLLIGAAFLIAAGLPVHFPALLGLYFLLTILYSFRLKRIVLVDIITLAGLYTLRILAGGQAGSTAVTSWMIIFSLFIFLSLAAVKRFAEIRAIRRISRHEVSGRGYVGEDLEVVGLLGTCSGLVAAIVVVLYVNSTSVTRLYRHPEILLFICPLILYWIMRIWLMAYRGELLEDPILFALTDRTSYVVCLACLVVILVSI